MDARGEEIFAADCPYCHTREVAFTTRGYAEPKRNPYTGTQWQDTFAICGKCGRGVVMTLSNDLDRPDDVRLKISPSPPDPPEHLPDDVGSYFRQGVNGLSEDYDASVAMFRTTVETALKEKLPGPDPDTRTLFQLIKEAEKQQKLTPDLAAWSHQIRIAGKEALHRTPLCSKEDAQEAHDFTELVLRYLYTLPGMLEQAQARRKPQDPTEQPEQPKQALPSMPSLRGGSG